MLVREVNGLFRVRFHFNAISNAIQCELQCKFRFVKLWGNFLSPVFRFFFSFILSYSISFFVFGSGLEGGFSIGWLASSLCKGGSALALQLKNLLVLLWFGIDKLYERTSKAWRGVASLVLVRYSI